MIVQPGPTARTVTPPRVRSIAATRILVIGWCRKSVESTTPTPLRPTIDSFETATLKPVRNEEAIAGRRA